MTATERARPWRDHYPAGAPVDLDLSETGTLVDMFARAVEDYAGRTALESFGVRMSYRDLGRRARRIAASLQKMGFRQGDRAAIMMPNVMAYPPLVFGILLAGGVVVNVNPLYTPRELVHQVNDSGARIIFVLENFAHTVSDALDELVTLETSVVVSPGNLLGLRGMLVNFVSRYVKGRIKPFRLPASLDFDVFHRQAQERDEAVVSITPDDPAFLQYTGGTTGVSKGAILTHRNLVANVLQCEAWMLPFLGRRDDHVMYAALPLYHILALTACCLFMTRIGASQVLIANPRDIPGFVKLLRTRPPTMLALVNTLYNVLSRTPGVQDVDFSRLAVAISGGMATQAAVAKRWKDLTGKPIVEGYGLSETSPVVCVNRLDIDEFTGTVGFPLPSTDIAILSPDGEYLPVGEIGEVCVRGPQVMREYWRKPEETAQAMTADGFFRTGDLGLLEPDGQLRLVDRLKDTIIVSGLKVFPSEVEEVLAAHPDVLEAGVVGEADGHSGEAVVAYVVLQAGAQTGDADLRAHAQKNLAPYKVPRRFHVRDSLPKTNVGKILRRALRGEADAGAQADGPAASPEPEQETRST